MRNLLLTLSLATFLLAGCGQVMQSSACLVPCAAPVPAAPAAVQYLATPAPPPVPSPVYVSAAPAVTENDWTLALSWLTIPLPLPGLRSVPRPQTVTMTVQQPAQQVVMVPQAQIVGVQSAPPPLAVQAAQPAPTNADLCRQLELIHQAIEAQQRAAGCKP